MKKDRKGGPTIFKARVVFPAIAILIPPTQAHDRAEPVNCVLAFKTGPPPPAVLTDQPSRANAAMTAAMDLMKNSHLIFRGWIRTNGNWTRGQLGEGKSERRDIPHQKTKKAIIRPVVIPILAGMELGSRSRDGQILLSMMYIQDEPIMVLILIISWYS